MSRCFALVTVVINFISRNHAFTVKRVLITYGKESQRFELLFAVKSFHSARIVSRLYGGELKHCTFGCDFTKHAQDFGTKFHIVSNKHCDQQSGENTEQQDNSEPWLCGCESPTPCTGQCPLEEIDQSNWLFIHYFTLETSCMSSFWI